MTLTNNLDWSMLGHDEEHSGNASGLSKLSTTTIKTIKLKHKISSLGSIISVPSIVQGKIYVGSGNNTGGGGTIFKIDIETGTIEKQYSFQTDSNLHKGSRQGWAGVARSPAVVDRKVYFSGLDGRLYCLDAESFNVLWITDLRNRDLEHNQPVQNTDQAEGWSSPLVVNGKVFVGFGEGEIGKFGFIYCLNANNGNVIWLFCTNKFSSNSENKPNVIPNSTVEGINVPAGFSTHSDPEHDFLGVSVWSSLAYDKKLNRVYAGTGNTRLGDVKPLPDNEYGSGILSLDADSGEFRGFFQPDNLYNYRPKLDTDVDIPAGPLLFTRNDDGKRILAIGNKAGAFFLLDPDSMKVIDDGKRIRQLLPYDNQNNPFPSIDNHDIAGENQIGIFSSAAVHNKFKKLFVGLGGYADYDSTLSPFMRSLNWNTLEDAWPTTGNNPSKYITANPPMYQTQGEKAIGSPTIVNDLVIITTTRPALYAFDAETGHCVWTSPDIIDQGNPFTWTTGVAIYGDYMVTGLANNHIEGDLYIYSL